MANPTKAIIVAAGMGRRLNPYTDEMPKCLVPVGDRPILAWQLDAFRAHGVTEFVIVRGYLGHVLEARAAELGPGIRFVDNDEFRTNNILCSLFCAEHELDGPLLVTYSDIVFTPDVVGTLMATAGDVALVIDRDFRDIYVGRTDHPLSEGEVSDLRADGNVHRVGKRALPPDDAWGEFIGLAKFSATGTAWLREAWQAANARDQSQTAPYQRAATLRNAYLTDVLQQMIDDGKPIAPAGIRGCWREIDTVQDLTRARAVLGSGQEDWK